MQRLLLLLAFSLCNLAVWAQPDCQEGEVALIVELHTDNWGYESSWSVTTVGGEVLDAVETGTLANNQLYETQICLPEGECVLFELGDTYGDGLINAGYIILILGEDTIANDPTFNFSYSLATNCNPGQVCDQAVTVGEGTYTTTYDNHWYEFTPDSVGTYLISTCGFTDCDTKIWVYDECDGNGFAEDNAGITFFDDNDSECAPQAMIEAYFDPNTTYLIRIGDNEDACGDSLTWQIQYLGPVMGCTDPNSCNYNPLASVDDGSCIAQGDPACPDGPDLVMREDVLQSSLQLWTIDNSDPCLIEEGCVTGYGQRDVIRFSTRIDNIGEMDYYIGVPSEENTQFTWNNCHNHFHYDGYAEYLLFDMDGNQLPSGFKNGFCVIDLGCMWGSGQYGCGNMGITAGCYDEYWRSLSCQWVDITDVPDGEYIFVTRVNWDNAPDALGRLEKDTLNNWAQVCINVDRSSGVLQVDFDMECEPFSDCFGTLYGNAQPDCAGECGGTAIRGDVNENGSQEMADAGAYVTSILAADIEATTCNDLNSDGEITVYDAALLADCLNYGAAHVHEGVTIHDHCNLPGGVVNNLDTVSFTILDANFDDGYLDIGMRNLYNRVNAYQFQVQGVQVTGVMSLIDPIMFPVGPLANMSTGEVIGISYQDSTIERSTEYQALCRIFFSSVTEPFVCLAEVKEVVNQYYEQAYPMIENACLEAVGVREETVRISVELSPNPMQNETILSFPNPHSDRYQLRLLDAQGQVVRNYQDVRGTSLRLQRDNLAAGVYLYELRGEKVTASGRLIIQ